MKLIISFLLFASTAVSARTPASLPYQTWEDFVHHKFSQKGIQHYYPDSQYLKSWQEDMDVVMDKKPPMPIELNQVGLNCKDKRLYPTHPQQITKEYLHGQWAYYDHGRLPPKSSACLRANPTGRFCVRPDSAKLVIISDTFEDNCGNYYRGYWMVTYLKGDESMGTLLSKGRTVYEKPHAQFANEYITGNTYEVRESDFLFLSTLWKGDAAKIKRGKSDAIARERYRLNGKLYINE